MFQISRARSGRRYNRITWYRAFTLEYQDNGLVRLTKAGQGDVDVFIAVDRGVGRVHSDGAANVDKGTIDAEILFSGFKKRSTVEGTKPTPGIWK